jgi:thioesterase domain-containing protein
MDAAALLSTLRARDVRLWIQDGQLKCSAPVGALDPALRAAIASRKQEILTFLSHAEALKNGLASIVPIKPEGQRDPIFAVSGHGADVFCLLPLARHLHVDQPMVGVQPPGLDGTRPLNSIESLARYQIGQIRQYRPSGPYSILGHCAGGTLAFEVAQQLVAAGEEVAFLALVGSPFPTMFGRASLLRVRIASYADALSPTGFTRRLRLRRARQKEQELINTAAVAARRRVENATVAAVRDYAPQPYEGALDLFITRDKWHQAKLWRPFARHLREHQLPKFEVNDLLLGPNVGVLAAAIEQRLDEIRSARAGNKTPVATGTGKLENAFACTNSLHAILGDAKS